MCLSLQSQPVGTVMAFAGEPSTLRDENWLVCDGRSLQVRTSLELFRVIGYRYGVGLDSINRSTFSLPDYRGYFLRGAGDTGSIDADKFQRLAHNSTYQVGPIVGSRQFDALQRHKHDDIGHTHPTTATATGGQVDSDNSDEKAAPPNTPPGQVLTGHANLGDPTDSNTGGGQPKISIETRPRNIYVYWIIKVK